MHHPTSKTFHLFLVMGKVTDILCFCLNVSLLVAVHSPFCSRHKVFYVVAHPVLISLGPQSLGMPTWKDFFQLLLIFPVFRFPGIPSHNVLTAECRVTVLLAGCLQCLFPSLSVGYGLCLYYSLRMLRVAFHKVFQNLLWLIL